MSALFLAEKGFRLDAIDISRAGITRLLTIAEDSKIWMNISSGSAYMKG